MSSGAVEKGQIRRCNHKKISSDVNLCTPTDIFLLERLIFGSFSTPPSIYGEKQESPIHCFYMFFFKDRKKVSLVKMALVFACCVISQAYAGDEDTKEDKKPAAPVEVEAPKVEAPVEAPEASLGEDDPSPTFEDEKPEVAPVKKAKKAAKSAWVDPDNNLDYSEAMDQAEPEPSLKGVLPPALGFRGYRPNMLAVGYGDRTPGIGGIIEYSWNRVGAGIYGSYRRMPAVGTTDKSQMYGGFYLLYRWLPWAFSPYFLLGIEGAYNATEDLGGTAGLGMEVQVYQEITFLFGYTYHSTVHSGFLGGALGWSF